MNLADFENLSVEEKRKFLMGECELAVVGISTLNANVNPEGGTIITDPENAKDKVIKTTFFGGSLQLDQVIDFNNP